MQEPVSFRIADNTLFKYQLLNWSGRFNSCCFLDNHLYQSPFQQQECLVAVGQKAVIQANAGDALGLLHQFLDLHTNEWIFGHLGFGLFQETEGVISSHASESGFRDLRFFVPEYILEVTNHEVKISGCGANKAQEIYQSICAESAENSAIKIPRVAYEPLLSRSQYLQKIRQLQSHILRGDCYEINYCQEFVANDIVIDPIVTYRQLSSLSPNPFSCFYKAGDSYLACASPERYLMKNGSTIISQPIKGTAPRDFTNATTDDVKRNFLRSSKKDQRENVMVVDLVRNDLSKICRQGSVQVEELFGIYTYPQVHQMISTITGEVDNDVSFTDIIKATFPMGSMTGAPKRRVLELINTYEASARGLFSGSVGYINPAGNFDFNVVIRSIVYNSLLKQLSFHVGGGITHYSEPEKEYEECLLKAAAIMKVLDANGETFK